VLNTVQSQISPTLGPPAANWTLSGASARQDQRALQARIVERAGKDVLTAGWGPALREQSRRRRTIDRKERRKVAAHCRLVNHPAELGTRGGVTPATKMLGLAEAMLPPAVLTNAVWYGTPEKAATADLADAARLLTPLAQLDQVQANGQAYLKPESAMRQVARMLVDIGSHKNGAFKRLLRHTEQLADRCSLDAANRLP
jgi:error-prone DNA polymerase